MTSLVMIPPLSPSPMAFASIPESDTMETFWPTMDPPDSVKALTMGLTWALYLVVESASAPAATPVPMTFALAFETASKVTSPDAADTFAASPR